jgi:hypothetical protein
MRVAWKSTPPGCRRVRLITSVETGGFVAAYRVSITSIETGGQHHLVPHGTRQPASRTAGYESVGRLAPGPLR